MVPFAKVPFRVPIFDPQPFWDGRLRDKFCERRLTSHRLISEVLCAARVQPESRKRPHLPEELVGLS